eukprot:11649762-Prorocentrum_lima.AAC.1
MTSSLVGSEMCIRDRNGRRIQWKIDNEAFRWSGTNDIVYYMAGTISWSCLLYTSDAADDM